MATSRVNDSYDEHQQAVSFEETAWEEECYREACALAREKAQERLGAIEKKLFSEKPTGWSVIGFRERTIVTRFGEVRARRRMYRDTEGRARFLLDERLGWRPNQVASVSLTERIVSLSSRMSFREAERTVSTLTGGVLSTMTVHRLLQGVAKQAIEEEESRWESCFETGADVCEGQSDAEVLYTEADGVWVHLQRESQSHYEVKSGIVYRGWERIGGGKEERYRLTGKRVYCHANKRVPFWEGASLEWSKTYDLSKVKLMVVGGDGANWIEAGTEEFASSVFQLDGFHLSRACGRGYGREAGRGIYQAVRAGADTVARQLIAEAEARLDVPIEAGVTTEGPGESKNALKAKMYVEANILKGKDWRNRVQGVPSDARSLGTMESNGDKLIANRMKKRGMSWTIKGALRMAKAVQLERNGELTVFCRPGPPHQAVHQRQVSQPMPSASQVPATSWLEAGVPALKGPNSSSPWVSKLRDLVYGQHLLN